MKSPLLLLKNLLADVGRFDPRSQGLERDMLTLEARFEHEGIGFITVALGTFADHFDQWLAKRVVSPVPGFRNGPRSSLPAFLSGLIENVFDKSTGTLREDYCLSSIKSVRQILRFFKKALISENEDKLHVQEERKFYEKESRQDRLDERRLSCLRRVGHYVLNNLDTQVEEVYDVCRHGPGAVAERVVGNQKWTTLVEQIESFDLFPESSYDLNLVDRDKGILSTTKFLPESKSRFVTVPKSVTARRGITVEPLMMQFYQQGLNKVLRDAINRCDLLSTSLDLTDQSKNQQLALEGSRNGYWATLDLSSASDLLLNRVVGEAFSAHPRFLEAMQRSRSLLSNGNSMQKYAGMGNATTFPVQSVVFALLSAIAITEVRGEPPTKEAMRRSLRCVRVFGDDIIVPTNTATRVADVLESVGLKVNRNKSFFEGNFRESCGVDAFGGVDVTPIYFRLDPRQTVISDQDVGTLVSTSNQLWLEGYYSLSTYIKDHVTRAYGKLPYVLRGSGAVGWTTRKRTVIKQRYDGRLQRYLQKVPVASPKRSKDPLDGYPALLKFFLTSLLERDRGHLQKSVQRYSNQVRWRWVPVIPVVSTFTP